MKKKDDFCRESNHFLKSVCLALCLISSGGSAVYAATLQTEQTTVTVRMNNCTIKDVFDHIEKNSEFVFVYHGANINLHRRVNLDVRDKSVEVILERLFKGTDVEYIINNRQIIVRRNEKKENSSLSIQQAKKITVTGIVKDTHGEPLIGVNVLVKGSRTGTITDMDGHFLLNEVSPNAMVSISYIGYKTEEIALNNRSSLTITLTEDSEQLDEVVVVGYGTQKKVNLTGSVSSVKFDEELANRPITDASQALSGKVSGVWISQNSGKPGDDGAQLRIRGWGTLNNSDPLVIIDGVEGVFSQINPSDIESITVLKDAASAAIYGSKAANGVVLVTTKMGKNNEKTHVELNSYVGVQQLGRRFDLVTNSAELMTMANQALANGGESPLYPESLISDFKNGTDPYKYPNTDWYEHVYRNALITGHNLSIRGGSEKLSSFLSLNYLKQEGIITNTDAERFGMRANLEYKVNSWLKVGARLNYIRRNSQEPFDLSRVFFIQSGAAPFIAPYTRDGRFGSVEAIAQDGTLLYDNRNPLIDASNGATKTTLDYMSLNAFATVDFTKDLNLQVTWASNGNWKMVDKYNETLYGYTDSGIETMTINYNRDGLEMSREQISTMRNNFHATLNYSKKFVEKHSVAGILGAQLENYNIKNVYARRTDPAKDGLTQVDAGTNGIQGKGNMQGLRMASYFGRLNYAFADKYLFEMNLRADASSRFKRGNRWGVFPGFSAGWRLSEESFIKNVNIFSNMKLRASWGQLGNERIDLFRYVDLMNLKVIKNDGSITDYNYPLNGAMQSGAAITAYNDPNITWETTTMTNVGIDASLLNGNLDFSFEFFDKRTSDILRKVTLPDQVGGLDGPIRNIGEVSNKGFELNMGYRNNIGNFRYEVNGNMTFIKNKIVSLKGQTIIDGMFILEEGKPIDSYYMLHAIGIFQSEEEIKNSPYQTAATKPGYLKFEDTNGDGKITEDDRQIRGGVIPKITYGFNINLGYKDWDLGAFFQGVTDVYTYGDRIGATPLWFGCGLPEQWLTDAWTPERGTSATLPILTTYEGCLNENFRTNDFWLRNASYLRLKNLQLSYNVPVSFLKSGVVKRLKVFVNAQNLFTFSPMKDFDPEKNLKGSNWYAYPSVRTYTAGVNVTF